MHLTDKKATALIMLFLLPGLYLAWQQSLVWWRYESMGPLCWDGGIFLTVGRAILNGLVPYRDIFENKPPGIFIISALSLYLTDSYKLGSYMEAASLIAYPAAMGGLLWHLSKNHKLLWYRILLTGAAALFGSVLAVYSLVNAGQYETESFGALFGMLFIVSIMGPKRMGTGNIILSGALLLATVGIKEPFLLTILCCVVLIYSHNLRELYSRFLLPVVLVCVVGTLLMVALGWLLPYTQLYLFTEVPRATVGRSNSGFVNWYAGQQFSIWSRTFYNLVEINVLPILIVLLLACALVRPFWKKQPLKWQLVSFACIVAAIVMGIYTVAMRRIVYNHHYVFMVPLYVALALTFLRDMANSMPDKRIMFVFLMVALSSISMTTNTGYANTGWMYNFDKDRIGKAKKIAAYIDEVLDSCSVERYMNVSGLQWAGHPVAFTKHSPYGPLVFQAVKYMESNVYHRDGFTHALEIAPIVVYNRNSDARLFDLLPYLEDKLEQNFTLEPPACAKKIAIPEVTPNDYMLFYRKSYFKAANP